MNLVLALRHQNELKAVAFLLRRVPTANRDERPEPNKLRPRRDREHAELRNTLADRASRPVQGPNIVTLEEPLDVVRDRSCRLRHQGNLLAPEASGNAGSERRPLPGHPSGNARTRRSGTPERYRALTVRRLGLRTRD